MKLIHKMDTNKEKTFEMLKNEFETVEENLKQCQIQLMKKLKEEKVSKAQIEMLKEEVYNTSNKQRDLKTKLDLIRQEIEEKIKGVIKEVELAYQKNNCTSEADVLRRKRDKENGKLQQEYHCLKGEIEALAVFKEYQDLILDELAESIQKKKDNREKSVCSGFQKN